MRRLFSTLLTAATLGLAAIAAPGAGHAATWTHLFWPWKSASDSTFGDVRVFAPAAKPNGVVALISDDTGFGHEETELARGFVARGELVIGFNWPTWRRHVAARRSGTCTDFLSDIEAIVTTVERQRHVDPYETPVLAGLGLGGSVARALAPLVSSHRIAGVVALRSSATLKSETPICGAIAHRRGDAYVYEAPPRAYADRLKEVDDGDENAATEAAEALQIAAGPHGPGDLADLPLFVTQGDKLSSKLAVILTGDGGMGGVDQELSDALAGRGITVATIDSRRYFWSERDPKTAAADIARIFQHFRREAPVDRIALVGYSFGADVLPLVYNLLPPEEKRDVAVVSMLSISPVIDFRVEFDDRDYPNAVPLLPAAARMDAPRVQCLYGEDDKQAAMACPALALARPDVEVSKTPGGHGFDGNMEHLADIISAPLFAPLPARPTHMAPPGKPASPAGKPARLRTEESEDR